MSSSVANHEGEGFICPYCLVGFSSPGKLQGHFVDMHSGHGTVDDYDALTAADCGGEEGGDEEDELTTRVLGHQLRVVRLARPKTCDVCSEIIWQDGLVCGNCQLTLHCESCEGILDSPCAKEGDDATQINHKDPSPRQQPQTPMGILPLVRRQVAKVAGASAPVGGKPAENITNRDRYVNDEFDLDLTYITERIIAMSFPASGMESAYRNNLKDVAKMLRTKHEDNYMIFNLSERSYDISRFNNQVLDFGWPDHLAPSLERLSSVCKSIKSWLDSDALHVAVVHCKGGKGRTGCVIAAFMHYSEICQSAEAALDRFAMKRFYDNKLGGVTQPSQRKYVHYFADLLTGKIDLHAPPVLLQHVIMHGIPNMDSKGGCRPFLKIYANMKLVHTSGLYVCQSDKERVKISMYGGLKLEGEILLKCFHKKTHTGMDSIFRCQFHSAVVASDLRLVYTKQELDDAFKDKRFPEGVKVELIFDTWSPENRLAVTPPDSADIRSSLLDGRQQQQQQQQQQGGATSNGGGPFLNIDHDPLTSRDSYASFVGGFDSGKPDSDLISFEPPAAAVVEQSGDKTASFKMRPEDIARIPHPDTSQIYTVINKPSKPSDAKLTPDPAANGGQVATAKDETSPPPSFKVPPSRPPPPKFLSKCHHPPPSKPSRPPPPAPPVTSRSPQPPKSTSPPLPPPPNSRGPPPPSVPAPQPPTEYSAEIIYAEVDDDIRPSASSPLTPPTTTPTPTVAKQPPVPPSKPHSKGDPPVKREKPEIATKPANISPKHSQQHQLPFHKQLEEKLHGKPKKKKHFYTEINPDQPVQLTPVPMRSSAVDNDMWAQVKYTTMPGRADSLSNKSLSSGNINTLSSSEVYTNLSELSTVGAQQEEEERGRGNSSQRRHSFSEGVERLVIRGSTPNRGSIIPVNTTGNPDDLDLEDDEPEYKNLGGPGGCLEGEDGGGDRESAIYDDPEGSDMTLTPAGVPPSTAAAIARQRALAQYVNTVIAANDQGGRGAAEGEPPANGILDIDQDYVNPDPEGQFHIYSNQDELLEKLRCDHQPVPDQKKEGEGDSESNQTAASSSSSSQSNPPRRGSGASFLKFLKQNFSKPKQPSIHSGKISEEDRIQTLAPFEIQGIDTSRVNRDYEAFFKRSAWGGSPNQPEGQQQQQQQQKKLVSSQSQGALPTVAVVGGTPPSIAKELRERERDREEVTLKPQKSKNGAAAAATDSNNKPEKPDRPKNLLQGRQKPKDPLPPTPTSSSSSSSSHLDPVKEPRKPTTPSSPQPQRRYKKPMKPPASTGNLASSSVASSLTDANPPPLGRAPSPPVARRPLHAPLVNKPSAPSPSSSSSSPPSPPSSRPHGKLKGTNSVDPPLLKSRSRDERPLSSVVTGAPGERKVPPKKPPPYYPPPDSRKNRASESGVKALMPYWYRPNITRDEAIDFVRQLPPGPGSFIVRDSQTVSGGYALTLKVSEQQVRQRKKLPEDTQVREDQMVTHFLIQPDPEGVKLQGWNEKAFKSLPEFITAHTADRLCLPCLLVMPHQGSLVPTPSRRRPVGMREALQTGAACDLVYLGSVDVSGAGSDQLLSLTIQQLKSLELSTMNIVTFKAAKEGITLTDNVNGMYIKRQYPISSVTYCGLDQNDTRWDFPSLPHLGEVVALSNKPCFGLVHHPQDAYPSTFCCLVFAEFDSAQPVSSVVKYVQRIMRESRK